MPIDPTQPARVPCGTHLRGFLHKSFLEDIVEVVPNLTVAFDVGAHEGRTAAQFLRFFPEATVYSFEPSPRTFATLMQKGGNVPRLVIENLALSDLPGKVAFHEYGDNEANSLLPADPRALSQIPVGLEDRGSTSVTATTIDDYCRIRGLDSIDLLKFDIQGNELRALVGASEMLLAKRIRAIYLEVSFIPIYLGQGEFHQIQKMLCMHGFQLFDFYNFSYGPNGQLRWGDVLFLRAD